MTMKLTIKFLIICFVLTGLLFLIGQILPSKKSDLQKSSPYECGFDPIKSTRLPFSFRFFLVALLFLLFDLEIAILLSVKARPHALSLVKTWQFCYVPIFLV